MTWAKLSDDYSDDCWTLSDEAFRTHTEALVWNGRKLLDCRIPVTDVPRFAKHAEDEVVQELLDTGWWSREGDTYLIRHHASYQRQREAVLRQQANSVRNGAKGGRPKREQASEIQPVSQPLTHVGIPDANPKGQARTGQASTGAVPTKEPEQRDSERSSRDVNPNDEPFRRAL